MVCLLIFPFFSSTPPHQQPDLLHVEGWERRAVRKMSLSFSGIHAPCAWQMKLGNLGCEIELILSHTESFSGVSRKPPYHLRFVTFNSLSSGNVSFAYSFACLFVCYGSFCTCALIPHGSWRHLSWGKISVPPLQNSSVFLHGHILLLINHARTGP